MSQKLYEGVRVLDMTRYLVGGFATQMLADLGADVIKVEDPAVGDMCRADEPKIDGVSYYFAAMCRNKKSLSINLKSNKGKNILYKLIRNTDILVENYRSEVASRLGLDYEAMARINPRLIYCSIKSFDKNDARSASAAHDINIQAATGYLSVSGGRTSPFHLADMATWTAASQVISAALYRRERTGSGLYVEVPMFDSLCWWMGLLLSRYHFQGGSISAKTLEYPALCYNVYETKDGALLALGMVEAKFWKEFCHSFGMEDLVEKQFRRQHEDPAGMERMVVLIRSKTMSEWTEWLAGRDLCISPVESIEEVVANTLASGSDIVEYVDYPRIGKTLQTRLPFRLQELMVSLGESTAPPELGEHNMEILQEMGLPEREIASLVREGVVGGPRTS